MRYNQRVKVVTRTYDVKDIDNDYEEIVSDYIPARVTGLSANMSMSVFGDINLDASAVHVKGLIKDVDAVIIDGNKRQCKAVMNVRKNTVIIIAGD